MQKEEGSPKRNCKKFFGFFFFSFFWLGGILTKLGFSFASGEDKENEIKVKIEHIKNFLRGRKYKAIVVHPFCDLDAICAAGVIQRRLNVPIYVPKHIDHDAKKCAEEYGIKYEIVDSECFDDSVYVDFYKECAKNCLIIDHHDNAFSLPFSSSCSILCDVFPDLDEKDKILLAIGIYSDTNALQYAEKRDIALFAKMLENVDFKEIRKFMEYERSQKIGILKNLGCEVFEVKGKIVCFKEVGFYGGEIANILEKYADLVFVFWQGIVTARSKGVDLIDFFHYKGHSHAASGKFTSVEEEKKRILSILNSF